MIQTIYPSVHSTERNTVLLENCFTLVHNAASFKNGDILGSGIFVMRVINYEKDFFKASN